MARIRSIKPEFWTSEQLSECSALARLLFVGMWSFSDDNGIHPASVARLKMEIFPSDDFTRAQIGEWVDQLIRVGLVRAYDVEGESFWQVTGWHHQRIDKPTYKHPLPSGEVPAATPRTPPASPLRNNSRDRRALFEAVVIRDGLGCAYCRTSVGPFELDHIVAVASGGSDDIANLCCACERCNGSKGCRSVEEFASHIGMRIEDMSPSIRRVLADMSSPERRGEEGIGESSSLRSVPSSTADGDLLTPQAASDNVHQHPASDRLMTALLDAYHRILPRCQHVAVLNPKRRKRIQAADKLARQVCAQQGWTYDPAGFWEAYFAECAVDPWMRGEVPNPRNPSWKQNLDVLLAEDRFAATMDRAIAAMREAA